MSCSIFLHLSDHLNYYVCCASCITGVNQKRLGLTWGLNVIEFKDVDCRIALQINLTRHQRLYIAGFAVVVIGADFATTALMKF